MKGTLGRAFLGVVFGVGLAACGSMGDMGAMKTGTQVSDDQMGKIVNNTSTQADVVAVVGQPGRKAQVGAKEIWYYDFNQIGQAIVGKNISETTAIEFNSKGTVTAHYKTAGTPGTSGNALQNAAGK